MEQGNRGTGQLDVVGDGEGGNCLAQSIGMQTVAEFLNLGAAFPFAKFAGFAATRGGSIRSNAHRRLRGRLSNDDARVEFAAVVAMLPTRNRVEHGVAV